MYVAPDDKLLYIRPPKTGSAAFRRAMNDHVLVQPLESVYWTHEVVWDPRYHDYEIYITVRNPYTRLVSLWYHCHRDGFDRFEVVPRPGCELKVHSPAAKEDFRRLNVFARKGFLKFLDTPYVAKWLGRTGLAAYHDSVLKIDFVIKQESLETDFLRMPILSRRKDRRQRCQEKAGKGLLQRAGAGHLPQPWWKYYTGKAERTLLELWGRDFEIFGYSRRLEDAITLLPTDEA